MRKILFFVFLMSTLAGISSAFAYTDQITVKADEAWQAAQEVLKKDGFDHLDFESKTLRTKWIYDQVVRKGKGPLKKITSVTMERRYRMSVHVVQRPFDTEIEVRGNFQERTMGNNRTSISWKKVRTKSEDFDLERAIFMRILNRLEIARTNP